MKDNKDNLNNALSDDKMGSVAGGKGYGASVHDPRFDDYDMEWCLRGGWDDDIKEYLTSKVGADKANEIMAKYDHPNDFFLY